MQRRNSDWEPRRPHTAGRSNALGTADGRYSERVLRDDRDRDRARVGGGANNVPVHHGSPQQRRRDVRDMSPDRIGNPGLAAAARLAALGARPAVDDQAVTRARRAATPNTERRRRHSAYCGTASSQVQPAQPHVRHARRFSTGGLVPADGTSPSCRTSCEVEDSTGKRTSVEREAALSSGPAAMSISSGTPPPTAPPPVEPPMPTISRPVHSPPRVARGLSPMGGRAISTAAIQVMPPSSAAKGSGPAGSNTIAATAVQPQSPSAAARSLGPAGGTAVATAAAPAHSPPPAPRALGLTGSPTLVRAHSAARCRQRHEPQRARSADPRRRRSSLGGEQEEPRGREDSPDAYVPAMRQATILGKDCTHAWQSPTEGPALGGADVHKSAAQPTTSVAALAQFSRHPPPFKTLPSTVFGGKYAIGRYLGRGASATVWEATHADSNLHVAIKVFDQGARDKRQAAREMKVLSRIRHPCVVEAFEVIETSLFSYLVCGMVDGESLRAHAQRMPGHRLNESAARCLYQQVVDGVNFLHERLVVHRDLKLENLLLDKAQENVKIIDFGFAAQVNSKDAKLRAFCGTPSYMAPEIIRGEAYSGFAADVWALGVVIFTLLAGVLPFTGRTELQLYAKIRRGTFACPDVLGELPRRLVRALLKMDPTARPPVGALLKNAWVLGAASQQPAAAGCTSPTASTGGSVSTITALAAAAAAAAAVTATRVHSPSKEAFGAGTGRPMHSPSRQPSSSAIGTSIASRMAVGGGGAAQGAAPVAQAIVASAGATGAAPATYAAPAPPSHGRPTIIGFEGKSGPGGTDSTQDSMALGGVSPGGRGQSVAAKAGYPVGGGGGLRRPSLDTEHVARLLGQREICGQEASLRGAIVARQLRCAPASVGGS